MQRFSPKASSVLEKKIFKGLYHIWTWWPSWSMDRNHFSKFSFPQPKEAPYKIWAKLAQGLQRRSHLKMLTDGRTDGQTHARTDNGRKVITIAYPEHSSGELKKTNKQKKQKKKNITNSYYSKISMARTFLVPWKIIRDMDCSSRKHTYIILTSLNPSFI